MDQFSKERTAYPVAQLACIVNQLHRLALIMPEAKFPSGMTVSQLSTLGYLSIMRDGEDVYQRDIETFFKLRRSTVSSLLNTLERKGLLRREPVPHDARLKKLVLTEAGLAISGQARSVMQKMNQVLIQGLSPEEVTQFSELLGKVEYALSSSNCQMIQAKQNASHYLVPWRYPNEKTYHKLALSGQRSGATNRLRPRGRDHNGGKDSHGGRDHQSNSWFYLGPEYRLWAGGVR